MRELLKLYDVSDDAIKLYLEGLGKYPFTLSELEKIIPESSNNEVKKKIDELINKKLVLLIKPRYSDILPHYLFLPPFAAIINAFSNARNISEDKTNEFVKYNYSIEKFQDNILQDIENISQDLIDIISSQSDNKQTTEILSEVEKNVKKFSQVLLTEVNELIAKLKKKSIINEIDIERVMRNVGQKIVESEEIISNMFSQFRNIINEMGSTNIPSLVESFKIFIRKLGDSLDKRSNELFQNQNPSQLKTLQIVEKSIFNVLTDYISKEKISAEKFLPFYSLEKIKEIISFLLEKCIENLTIILPNIEDFLPLEVFDLDYSEDTKSELSIEEISPTLKKTNMLSKAKPSITKEQKKELEEKINSTARRVADLKGYELSHDLADILAAVSEINPKSLIIENIQGWLNRLLVIRKYLDQNTQYLILEDIEKWKRDYLKIKEKQELEKVEELNPQKTEDQKDGMEGETSFDGLPIKIISSEAHDNHYVKALKNKHVEYLRFKNNNIVAILGNDTYLAYGICLKSTKEPKYELTGFSTSYKPLIELFEPNISKIIKESKPTREIQINKGFNEIIENINDYSGRKISKKLKNLLNVAFEKDGISLNILEFKLLISKLEKLRYPLEDEMKVHIIEELNKLNKKFSMLELVCPPEFRAPILDEEPARELEIGLKSEHKETEPLDPEKVNNLFDLFFEKIHDLKGVELGSQIDKFIEVILRLQGYSQIIDWKRKLSNLDENLEESLKEKIKLDFLDWKNGILSSMQLKGQTKEKEYIDSLPQKDYLSESNEEYISPGLYQSQFKSGDLISSEVVAQGKKVDPFLEMKKIFDEIEERLSELKGIEISKKMQNIIDIILEYEGYSMELKELKDWINKLRGIRKPLDDEVKENFILIFFKWKEKYSKKDSEDKISEFQASTRNLKETEEVNLVEKINGLAERVNTSTGSELSKELQDISDIVLPSYGAVTANALRQWISKLRAIRDLLEDEIKQEFLEELGRWKEKFT